MFSLLACLLVVAVVGLPRFAVIRESNETIVISQHKFYSVVLDTGTLWFIAKLKKIDLPLVNLTLLESSGYTKKEPLSLHSLRNVENFSGFTGRNSLKLSIIQDEPSLFVNRYIGNICNPSIIYFRNRFLVAARPSDWRPVILFAWLENVGPNITSVISVSNTSYLGIGPGYTKLRGVRGFDSHGEDPRMLVIDSKRFLMVSTTTDVNSWRIRLDYFEYQHNPPSLVLTSSKLLEPPYSSSSHQKNWAPFLYSAGRTKSVYFVHSMHESLTVIRQVADEHLNQTQVVSVVTYRDRVTRLWGEYGQPRGGSPARKIGRTTYLAFFHSNSHSRDVGLWNTYFSGACIFSSRHPFEMYAMSRVPLYSKEWYVGPWMKENVRSYVYFAMNFFFVDLESNSIIENVAEDGICETPACWRKYNVTVSYGVNDHHGYLATMNLAALLRTMISLDKVSTLSSAYRTLPLPLLEKSSSIERRSSPKVLQSYRTNSQISIFDLRNQRKPGRSPDHALPKQSDRGDSESIELGESPWV